MNWLDPILEKNLLPDPLLRLGIRRLIRERHRVEWEGGAEAQQARLTEWVRKLRESPIAIETEAANDQHYEVPGGVLRAASSGATSSTPARYWPEGVEDLDAAEEAMLQLTCERAGLADGQRILELGCGWGSLTLWMAERYPASQITAVSNSSSQKAFIDARGGGAGASPTSTSSPPT